MIGIFILSLKSYSCTFSTFLLKLIICFYYLQGVCVNNIFIVTNPFNIQWSVPFFIPLKVENLITVNYFVFVFNNNMEIDSTTLFLLVVIYSLVHVFHYYGYLGTFFSLNTEFILENCMLIETLSNKFLE